MNANPRSSQAGATLIEVLVTIVIVTFGLLGMAGLQARMQLSEMESYQRSQALILLGDMASRLSTNRLNVASYASAITYGEGANCPTESTTAVQRDLKEWCNALKGAAVKSGTVNEGAMVGARGCIEQVGSDYMITIAWQGLTPLAAPPASVTCGANQYNGGAGAKCINDLCRRAVTTVVRIGTLT